MFTYLNIPKLNSVEEENAWSMIIPENKIPLPSYISLFSMYVIRDGALREFLYKNFGRDLKFRIQTLEIGYQQIHIDYGRNWACNYLLDLGGDKVFTHFYSSMTDTVPIFSEHIELNRWHRLDVAKPHNVTGINHKRVAVTVCDQ